MTLPLFFATNAPAQEKDQMVRLAKLVIDSAKLEGYKTLLKEEIETSVRVEPGVITLYAVSEKNIMLSVELFQQPPVLCNIIFLHLHEHDDVHGLNL